ncbi:MAG: LLM class F420-dependent oxidoreductase [Acidimicrobiales bacterium]|nr:LLM class F420-dependent oxidoreductase [Acidimicrobiales bacterium]MDG2219386.1 LLM class F420-dependent oxidoreductase [Acidimicrobiales bacterium]
MRLGLSTGYWGSGPPSGVVEAIKVADRLGFEHIWTAEAYGSDALTPLAWWGATTQNVKLGTSIMQMSARTPTATAMAAMTMDHLSGGRFIAGIGASGPQVVEGWYGQPYSRPLERTREYVNIMRQIFAREDTVGFEGKHFQLPFPHGTGLGKPLKSTVHPYRQDIPIYLAAEGPKNVALSAEICDGWLPLFFAPKDNQFYKDALQSGMDAGGRNNWDDFEIAAMCSLIPGADVEDCANKIRPMLALYVGGMGAKGKNFHFDVFVRMGFEAECDKIQQLYLSGNKAAAIAAVPLQMCEAVALLGPPSKIKDELALWDESVVNTLLISGPPQLLEFAADLVS